MKVDITKVLEEIKKDTDPQLFEAYGIGISLPGAIPCGTLVEKVATEEGDHHKDGKRGIVYGTIENKHNPIMGHMYVVCFDTKFHENWSNNEDQLSEINIIASYKIKEVKDE